MMMRDLDKNPYTEDEKRIVDFFWERGIGAGDDPIAFLLASYAMVMEERRILLDVIQQGKVEDHDIHRTRDKGRRQDH